MKKILAMAVSIALIATMVITGSVAYFTDTDDDVNVFTVGNVQITQNEQQRVEQNKDNPELEDFEDGPLNPYVNLDGSFDKVQVTSPKNEETNYTFQMYNEDDLQNYKDKIVTVTNDGKSGAYIRTIFAIPTANYDSGLNAGEEWLHWNMFIDGYNGHPDDNGWHWGDYDSEKVRANEGIDDIAAYPGNGGQWDVVENVIIDGKEYDLYVATNDNILAPGDTTAPSMTGVYMDKRVDFDGTNYTFKGVTLDDISEIKILVATQAVQAEGFSNAWQALDEAFGGKITETNHPWYEETVNPAPSDAPVTTWYGTSDTSWYTGNATEYSIDTAAEFAGLAELVNGGTSFSGKTIKLTADLDLNNQEWTPIGQTGGYYADTYFQGTFDGQDHTIKNLKVTKWEAGSDSGANYASGLFGFIDCGATGTIKNLTIDGATIKGHHWTGAIAGYLSGNMDKCTVKNAEIVCPHTNSEACGDKAGVVVGYVNGTQGKVTNCTAENSTVQAGRDAGQVVGGAYATQVVECSATNVTVTAISGCTGANIRNEIIGREL